MNRKFGVVFLALGIGAFPSETYAQSDRAHQLASQASSQATAGCGAVTSVADCHPGKPTGCSHAANPRYDPCLNFLKNQAPARNLAPARILELSDFTSIEDGIPAELSQPITSTRSSQINWQSFPAESGKVTAIQQSAISTSSRTPP